MKRPLFVYGTLRDAQMLAAVLGRAVRDGERLPAMAPGFAVVHYPGRIYPALLRRPGTSAAGEVLLRLSSFETDLLDRFEGEEYRRGIVPVMIGEELHEADAYLPTVSVNGFPDWEFETWQQLHKHATLPRDAMQAEAIRRKLIAIRPN